MVAKVTPFHHSQNAPGVVFVLALLEVPTLTSSWRSD